MGTYVKQIPNDEAFWIGLVETNMRLGWEQCLVPLGNLNAEAAKLLAERLNVHLEVTDEGYVFKKDAIWIRMKREADQDRTVNATTPW